MTAESAWDEWHRVVGDPESGPLDVLRAVGTYQRYLAAVEQAAAKAARAGGHTWEEIGEAIGVSRQSAWQRLRAVRESRELHTGVHGLEGAPVPLWGPPTQRRFPSLLAVDESPPGPVSYILASRDGAPLCALWAGSGRRRAGVVAAPGHEAEAEQWRWLLWGAAMSAQFDAAEFVAFWAREGRPGYDLSGVGHAESLEALRSRVRELAA